MVESSVTVDDEELSRIAKGLIVFVGIEKNDGEAEASFMANKVLRLRVFPDKAGRMNLSCMDVNGEILVVSQFTLLGDCSSGLRPGFDRAADPEIAERLYRFFINKLRGDVTNVQEGVFGAKMMVHVINEGPATFVLEK